MSNGDKHNNTSANGGISTRYTIPYTYANSQTTNENIQKLATSIDGTTRKLDDLINILQRNSTNNSTMDRLTRALEDLANSNRANNDNLDNLRTIYENTANASRQQAEEAERHARVQEEIDRTNKHVAEIDLETAMNNRTASEHISDNAREQREADQTIRTINQQTAEARRTEAESKARLAAAREAEQADRVARERERRAEAEREKEEKQERQRRAQALAARNRSRANYDNFIKDLGDYGTSMKDRGGTGMQNTAAIGLGLLTGGMINPVIAKTLGLDRLITAPIHLVGTAMKKTAGALFKNLFVKDKTSSAVDDADDHSEHNYRRSIMDLLTGIFHNTRDRNRDDEDGRQENPIMSLFKKILGGAGSLLGMIGGGLLTLVAPAAIAALIPAVKEFGKDALSNFLKNKGMSENMADMSSGILVDAIQGASIGFTFSKGNWKVAALGAAINLALGAIKGTSSVLENEAAMAKANPTKTGLLDNVDWEGRAELALRWGIVGLTAGGLPGMAIGAALGFASPTILKFGKRLVESVQMLLDGHPIDAFKHLTGADKSGEDSNSITNTLKENAGAAGVMAGTGIALKKRHDTKKAIKQINEKQKRAIEDIKEQAAREKADATTKEAKKAIDAETKQKIKTKKAQTKALKARAKARNLKAGGKLLGKTLGVVAAADMAIEGADMINDLYNDGLDKTGENYEKQAEAASAMENFIGLFSPKAGWHLEALIGKGLKAWDPLNKYGNPDETPNDQAGGYGAYTGSSYSSGSYGNLYKNELYSRARSFNIIPDLLENMGLHGSINSPWTRGGNSIPAINSKNTNDLKALDNLLHEWGYDVVYTSAMGGHVPNSGHGRGNKVDLQLKKNGRPVHLTAQQLMSLKQAGYWGPGTYALGWEPVYGQVGGGHYDLNVATGNGTRLPTNNDFGTNFENDFALDSGYMPSTNESMSFQLASINTNTESVAYSSAETSEAISSATNKGAGGTATISNGGWSGGSGNVSSGGGWSGSGEKQVYAYGDVAASFVLGKWLNV